MLYKSVAVTRLGGPEVFQVIERDLRAPAKGEARIRVLAASVCRPDVTSRRGEALYSGTPLGQKVPFVPGYAVIGVVDALGPGSHPVSSGDRVGAMTVTGGYSEYLYWKSDRLIPVPAAVHPADAVTLILNYIVAYQVLHRSVKVKPGETLLIIGASGGIGTALLQLGRLANLKMVGLASPSKHHILAQYGAVPLDYHAPDLAAEIRRLEPGGIDVVTDGMMTKESLRLGLELLRRGGRLAAYGEPNGFGDLFHVLKKLIAARLHPDGPSIHLYGTSFYSLGFRKSFLEDWATLFRWLEEGKIQPVIMQCFPILEAARANALMESGEVVGNLVLLNPSMEQ